MPVNIDLLLSSFWIQRGRIFCDFRFHIIYPKPTFLWLSTSPLFPVSSLFEYLLLVTLLESVDFPWQNAMFLTEMTQIQDSHVFSCTCVLKMPSIQGSKFTVLPEHKIIFKIGNLLVYLFLHILHSSQKGIF